MSAHERVVRAIENTLQEHDQRWYPCAAADASQLPINASVYYRDSRNLRHFIALLRGAGGDSCNLEAAWSRHRIYPLHLAPMSPITVPEWNLSSGSPIDGEFRCATSVLWRDRYDTWSALSRSDDGAAASQLLCFRLRQHVLPYLDSIDARRIGGATNPY